MVVQVSGTIPDSTLTPRQVRQKFSPQTLAGLGDSCYAVDEETGECLDFGGDSSTTLDTTGGFYGVFTPPSAPAGTLSTTDGYFDQGGDFVIEYSDGTWHTINPNGQAAKGSGAPPSRSSGTVTQAQSSAWPAIVNAIANAGVRIGTVALLPPGTSLLPNGTIVGSGQSLIRPGVVTSSSLSSTLNGILSNPMLLIGGFGLIALAMFAGGGRR